MTRVTGSSTACHAGMRFARTSWRAALAVVAGVAVAVAPIGVRGAGAALVSAHETVLSAPGVGRAVSLYGDDEILAAGSEAAFVYTRGTTAWTLETTLRPSDGVPGDHFGASVVIQDTYVVIGAPNATVDGKPGAGAAYVFARLPDGTWFQYPRLVSPAPSAGAHFGAAVGIVGEVQVIVGAPGAGTATIYARDAFPGDWALAAQLHAPGLGSSDAIAARFGASVAAADGVFTVGAPGASVAVAPATQTRHAGMVFAFRQVGSTFPLDAELVADPPAPDGHFGQALAMQAGTTIVGAPGSRSLAAFQFEGPGVYTPIGRDLGGSGFGAAIGAGGSFGIAADPTARAAYVYGREVVAGGVLVSTLTPQNGPVNDGFGASVAVGGTTAVVGAPGTHTIHVFDVVSVATPDHALISLHGALSYSTVGDVIGDITVTRAGGRITAVTGAGRINVAADNAPFVGMDLHASGRSPVLVGQVRIRDYATGFVHTLQTFGFVKTTSATRVDGTAIAVDLSQRVPRLVIVTWSLDDLAS